MHQPPEFDTGESLVELCDLRINSGRKLLVHTSGDKLEGVIGDQEFLEAFKDTEELGSLNTKDIHTQELINVLNRILWKKHATQCLIATSPGYQYLIKTETNRYNPQHRSF